MTFVEAQEVFDDPLTGIRPDPAHAEDEERDIIVGHTLRGLLLLVSFTRRDDVTRIISARKVTLNERRLYEEKSL